MSAIKDNDSPNDIAHTLLRLVGDGYGEAVTDVIEELILPSAGAATDRIEAVVLELLGMAARAAKDRTTPAENGASDEPYRLELYEHTGEALSIDDLGPVPRAALRALLALLADQDHDAAQQVELVLDNGSRSDAATLLATCLLWSGTEPE